jgi:hypothetical protein
MPTFVAREIPEERAFVADAPLPFVPIDRIGGHGEGPDHGHAHAERRDDEAAGDETGDSPFIGYTNDRDR